MTGCLDGLLINGVVVRTYNRVTCLLLENIKVECFFGMPGRSALKGDL